MHIRKDDLMHLTGTSLHIVYDSAVERAPDLTDGVAADARVEDVQAGDRGLPMLGLYDMSHDKPFLVASSPFVLVLAELMENALAHFSEMGEALDSWAANGRAELEILPIQEV